MTAPERIWAVVSARLGAVAFGDWADTVRYMPGGDEYIRADLVQAMVAEAVAVERAIWTVAIETYFDATAVADVEKYVAAMRAEGVR